jgi:hypothetical protein
MATFSSAPHGRNGSFRRHEASACRPSLSQLTVCAGLSLRRTLKAVQTTRCEEIRHHLFVKAHVLKDGFVIACVNAFNPNSAVNDNTTITESCKVQQYNSVDEHRRSNHLAFNTTKNSKTVTFLLSPSAGYAMELRRSKNSVNRTCNSSIFF